MNYTDSVKVLKHKIGTIKIDYFLHTAEFLKCQEERRFECDLDEFQDPTENVFLNDLSAVFTTLGECTTNKLHLYFNKAMKNSPSRPLHKCPHELCTWSSAPSHKLVINWP